VLKTAQPESTIGVDGWVSFPAPLTTVKGHQYQINIMAVDQNGNRVDRSVLLRTL